MTELETVQRAKMYMDKLAQGIDPITGREIPEDSTLNNVRLARCFFYVSGVLDQVIANGGVVGARKQTQFHLSRQQLTRIRPLPEPIRVTQLAQLISSAAEDPQMKKLKVTVITDWLLEKGFLEYQTMPDGKQRRVPSPNGIRIGLTVQTRMGSNGEYQSIYYTSQAQQFVLDHLEEMIYLDQNGA